MTLADNEEIIGILVSVTEDGNCCKLQFICIREIKLPLTAVPLQKLLSFVGKIIGVLNIDGQFFVRLVQSR
ncbi:hypothetical protein AYK25_10215 [Thermoplasmatales archaeon SM1-50]|nr:MAG: hypothetical protein AYK25_10215 [Thermoplasmatales archaeon SM1-50]